MGILTEPDLDTLVSRGCTACGAKKLLFRAFLDGRLPLLNGEPVGALGWGYDGEKFVDGVFEVSCAECKKVVFEASVCPRCNAEGGLSKALSQTNRYPVPINCPSCGGDEVKYTAMLPARVVYEGKRAERARTTTEMHEPGFHGYQVDCKQCGKVAELGSRCPLCEAPSPLRARPG